MGTVSGAVLGEAKVGRWMTPGGGVEKPCLSFITWWPHLPKVNSDHSNCHRAHFSAARRRLIISRVLFPRSSKGFLEVICLLVPTAQCYHPHLTDGKTGHWVVNLLTQGQSVTQWSTCNQIPDFPTLRPPLWVLQASFRSPSWWCLSFLKLSNQAPFQIPHVS